MSNDLFDDVEVPVELEASLQRHREHLAQLVVNLRSAGVDQAGIEQSVSLMIASYKQELIEAIKRMVGRG